MYLIEKTNEFDKWLRKLKDKKAKAKILIRIQRIEEHGNFGDCQPIGQGISELRIHHATGYRVYLKDQNGQLVLLLVGGDKTTQSKDIEKAKQLWAEYLTNKK
uniref:type II toxin-antitoxin system RelE/ParE family toxin n=1 Tax=Roseivirga sp. TaxID=1964215 RepID=UPI0040477DB2